MKELLDKILQQSSSSSSSSEELTCASPLDSLVSIATVCFAGLPSFGDVTLDGTGWDARGVVVLQPDWSTMRILPYAPATAMVLGTLRDVPTRLISPVCGRGLLQQVVAQAASQGYGINVGAELEFTLVDSKTGDAVDASNFGDSVTLNQREDFIIKLYDMLQQQEIPIELVHSESAPGQLEVVLRYQNHPVTLADYVLLTRETIRNVARQCGFKALFLPKLSSMEAGNGCHVHLSLYDVTTGQNLLINAEASAGAGKEDDERNVLSAVGQSFVEGILQHLPAIVALTLPTANSFRRVGPGCWTGSDVSWAIEDKEASVRLAQNLSSLQYDHVEIKVCDSTANLYLALVALIGCGLDGIANQVELRWSRNHSPSQPRPVALPSSLPKSLTLLERDPVLKSMFPSGMFQGYLALRRAEAQRAANMTLEEEFQDAFQKA